MKYTQKNKAKIEYIKEAIKDRNFTDTTKTALLNQLSTVILYEKDLNKFFEEILIDGWTFEARKYHLSLFNEL